MFIANHYVRVNGKVYTKGECIPEGLPTEKVEWLMRAGAIHEASAPVAGTPEEEPAEDEAAAPEIDVMSGIVQGEKSRKAGRRKTK